MRTKRARAIAAMKLVSAKRNKITKVLKQQIHISLFKHPPRPSIDTIIIMLCAHAIHRHWTVFFQRNLMELILAQSHTTVERNERLLMNLEGNVRLYEVTGGQQNRLHEFLHTSSKLL
jgi:hypothetical protein